jgi:hypothetical protein
MSDFLFERAREPLDALKSQAEAGLNRAEPHPADPPRPAPEPAPPARADWRQLPVRERSRRMQEVIRDVQAEQLRAAHLCAVAEEQLSLSERLLREAAELLDKRRDG